MVVIRLARTGAKKSPFYHVIATDRRNSRDGRYIERLGYFNPMARGQEKVLELCLERVDYWLAQGAQPSERVHNLVKSLKKGEVPSSAPSQSEIRKAQAEKAAISAKSRLEEELKAAAEAKATEEKAAKEAEKAQAAEAKTNEAIAEVEDTPKQAEGTKESEADK